MDLPFGLKKENFIKFLQEFKVVDEFNDSTTYTKGQFVYFGINYYVSLTNANQGNLPYLPTDNLQWLECENPYHGLNLIKEENLKNNAQQALYFFNENFFDTISNDDKISGFSIKQIAFMYVIAYLLIVENRALASNADPEFIRTSQSVNGISVSNQTNEKLAKNEFWNKFERNYYGQKYNQLIAPFKFIANLPRIF